LLHEFLADESGQDLIEYSLLMAFLALACVGILQGVFGGITAIWTTGNTTLRHAREVVSQSADHSL
jgi:Flp pilus assembly pilin Flp